MTLACWLPHPWVPTRLLQRRSTVSDFVEWDSLVQVVIIGVIVGAGLPFVFAIGVRAIAGKDARDESGHVPRRRKLVAVGAFGLVLLATVGAVAYIAGGGH